MTQKLIVLRHLATEDNEMGRFCSGDRDIPILANQAISREIIEKIQQINGRSEYCLAHTGLKRSEMTINILKQCLAYQGKILVLPEFRERIGGELAGLMFSEIKRRFPKLNTPSELWKIEAQEFGLENVEMFLSRLEKGLILVSQQEKNIILVAHAGTIKGIKAIKKSSIEERMRILCGKTPDNSECFHFYLKGDC